MTIQTINKNKIVLRSRFKPVIFFKKIGFLPLPEMAKLELKVDDERLSEPVTKELLREYETSESKPEVDEN